MGRGNQTKKQATLIDAAKVEIRRVRQENRRRRIRRAAMICITIALIFGWILGRRVLMIVTMRDVAMSPSINAGSVVVCLRQSFIEGLVGMIPDDQIRVRRGETALIAYDGPEDEEKYEPRLMIRRVVGLGGDTIDMSGGTLSVNGESVLSGGASGDRVYPVTVPTGGMFVVGDHSTMSVDSTKRSFGMPDENDVIARPVLVIWPIYSIGRIK